MPDIAGLNGGLVKVIPDPTDLLPIQDAQGITRPTSIAGVINAVRNAGGGGGVGATGATGAAGANGTSGVASWQLKTANYTALPGDRLRLDATASDIVITLPPTPSATDADILFQRLESGTNKVLLRAGTNKFNTQANQDGVFAPATINLIEGISYVNSTIGWLNQHNRLTFQAYAPFTANDPLFSSVVLLMPMTTASGITDVKGKSTINQGTTASTRNDPFGNNIGVRDFAGGGARISVNPTSDFAFGNGAFAIEMWLYPTAIPGGNGAWGLLDIRNSLAAVDWLIGGNSMGDIAFVDFSYPSPYFDYSVSPLILNQWNYICLSRTATDSHKVWINGVLVKTASVRSANITAGNQLLVGDLLDTASPYDGSFTGSMSNLRITRAYRDGSIVPTAAFPTS